MKTRCRKSLWLATLLVSGTLTAREPISIEALSRVPAIQSVSLSLDGRHVVALIAAPGSNGEDTALATWDVENLAAGPVVTPSESRATFVSARALKNGHVMARAQQEYTGSVGRSCAEGRSIGPTRTMVRRSFLTDVRHVRFREAFAERLKRSASCSKFRDAAELVEELPLDPDHVIILHRSWVDGENRYYRYNLSNGHSTLLFREPDTVSAGLFHPRTGELLTQFQLWRVGDDVLVDQVALRNAATGEFEVHEALGSRLDDRHTVDVVGLDEDSGKYLVLTDKFSDRVEARAYDPVTRQFDAEPLAAHPEYSVSALLLGHHQGDFGRILGFEIDAVVKETVFVDPVLRSIQAGLVQAFSDRHVRLIGFDDDRGTVLFSTESARHPIAYHLLLERERVVNLGASRNGIDPNSLGEQRWVSYTARDGRRVPALLDLPAGWSPQQGPLPTVVHPHGGPWERDYGGWDASGWTPFLTSRGYAVLRPQFRGSMGLGREHWIAGDAQWGQAMQDDKDDGARWLVEQGIADADRIAIFGYSYGGYAATAAVVRRNSPYVCAIAGAPLTHLALRGGRWTEGRVQRALQGKTIAGLDPITRAENAGIPILLFVGDRDTRTPAFHAEDFYNAVRTIVPSRFELIPDMPHAMPWYPRHHRAIYSLLESFLHKECFGSSAG